MIKLSKSQEKEERRALGKGMRVSVFGALLCWVPLLGVLLSSIGFVRINKRFTNAHKTRQRVYVAISLVILLASCGVLAWEAYVYTHDPYILTDLRDWLLDKITDGGYYSDYYYYDTTYQDYNDQYYTNPDAYTYQDQYAPEDRESE